VVPVKLERGREREESAQEKKRRKERKGKRNGEIEVTETNVEIERRT